MTYQQMTLDGKQDWNAPPSYQGASHASRTALRESVRRLATSVTSGRSTGVSLAKLSPDGLWLKMFGDCLQAKMDGSFEEYSGTLPTLGLMLDGVLIEPPTSERFTPEKGLRLLPTPTASDDNGGSWRKNPRDQFTHTLKDYLHGMLAPKEWRVSYPYPEFVEEMMGFPTLWTDLNALATP